MFLKKMIFMLVCVMPTYAKSHGPMLPKSWFEIGLGYGQQSSNEYHYDLTLGYTNFEKLYPIMPWCSFGLSKIEDEDLEDKDLEDRFQENFYFEGGFYFGVSMGLGVASSSNPYLYIGLPLPFLTLYAKVSSKTEIGITYKLSLNQTVAPLSVLLFSVFN